jgi:hypothetical protein
LIALREGALSFEFSDAIDGYTFDEGDRSSPKLLNDLKRQLPQSGPENGRWKRPLVQGCGVANIRDWNAAFPKWQITEQP